VAHPSRQLSQQAHLRDIVGVHDRGGVRGVGLGAGLITGIGLFWWEPMTGADWLWMGLYGGLAVFANWLLIRCYEVAEASAVQPFAYFQIVFVSIAGLVVFGETLAPHVVLGAAIVVGAGLVALLYGRRPTAQVPA
jgi:drug/metabolite transporter (DMT)-like permease